MKKEQKIGLFAIIIVVGIFLVINFLKGKNLFNRQNTYYAVFDNVEGIDASAPVYMRGFKVGIIDDVRYDSRTDKFIVEFSVSRKYEFSDDSKAESYSSDIMGGKALRITTGLSETKAKSGDTLASGSEPDMISSLVSGIGPLKNQLSSLIAELNTTVASINEILDTDTKAGIEAAVESLRSTAENAAAISSGIKESMPEIQGIAYNLNKLAASLGNSTGDIESTMRNLSQASEDLKEAELKNTISQIRSLLEKIQEKDNSLGLLLNDTSLHDNLNGLLENVDSLVTRISENPKKYIRISVF